MIREQSENGRDDAGDASVNDLFLSEGVPLVFVIKFLTEKVRRQKLIRESFIFFPFLAMFVFFATGSRDVTEDYYVNRVLRDRVLGNEIPFSGGINDRVAREVTRTYEDITSIDDFYDWIQGVLVPNLWVCSTASVSAEQFPTQQGRNYLLGSLRVRTLRAGRDSCEPDDQLFKKAGAEPPPVCDDIPEGNLWRPPVLDGVGTVVMCWFVSNENGLVVTLDMDQSSLVVRHLDESTRVYVAETTERGRMARIEGPVAGWIQMRNLTTNRTNVEETQCEVDCINCLGRFASSTEETALRFNVSNPFLPVEQRYLEANRFYTWIACSEITGGTYILGDIDYYHCGGYVVDIAFNETCSAVKEGINVLRGDGSSRADLEPPAPFLDEVQSRFASVEYFVYTPQSNSFVSVKLYIEIGPSAVVLPRYQFRAFKMWTSAEDLGHTVYDFFFFSFVLYCCVAFVMEWASSVKRTGRKFAIFLDDGGFWMLLEVTNLITLLVVFGMRWAWWDVSKRTDNTKFPMRGYPPDLDFLKDLYMAQIYANSINIVLSFLKILKYCQLSDKLNILTVTMGKSKEKVVGVLLLFAWSVFAYAIAGHTLFGSALYEFRNINAAFSALIRMLLGDFDYEALRRENRFLAGAFFWSYCVLALFLLLNFIIAIISEAFSEASKEVTSIPFHVSVARFKETVIRTLQPANIISSVHLTLKRKSRSHLLDKALVNMELYQMHLTQELDATEAESTVVKDKLKSFMGVEVFTLLGEDYVDTLWVEVMEDYHFEQENNAEELENAETQELIEAGINAAIGESLDIMRHMPHAVMDLEESVDELIDQVVTTRRKGRRQVLIASPT
ncbi:Polycystin-2 [Diplonema papillatum]|nr:Polycystin-2 [Diplonema papillatum]